MGIQDFRAGENACPTSKTRRPWWGRRFRLPVFLLLGAPLFAQSDEFFEKKIRPIFATKCYACHAGKTPMAGLDFSSPAGFESVIGGRLMQAVGYEAKIKMPPSGKLPDPEIADIRAWIEMGAPRPKESAKPQRPSATHGAFQPVKDYPPPLVKNQAWIRSPIDRFILAKLEEKGMKPASRASKLTLLRRVTYDLIGLPPTKKEIADFLADQSPDAYIKVVDRLLASPQYGENWGRHWLDVARFADSTGMDEDHVYPYAWRYRDYVVKAFNDDLPYDRFITEQLAGDLLHPANPVATGFLALGPKPLAQQDRIKMIYDVVDEQIDTVSKAFMGLTVACARCHDHKFDPILTKDYYSLASIFASTENFRNLGRPGAVSYIYYAPLDPAAFGIYQAHRWRMYAKQLEMEEALAEDWAREYGLLRPRIAEFLTAAWKAERHGAKPEGAVAEKWARWLHGVSDKARQGYLKKLFDATDDTIAQVAREYQEAYVKSATRYDGQLDSWRKRMATEVIEERDLPGRPKVNAEVNAFFAALTFNGGPMELHDSPRVAELRREWKQLESTVPPEPPMASAVRDGAPVDQRVFLHGDNNSPGEPVARQFPVVLAGEAQKPITKGSGRLELARWLTGPDHPLTARVMVNRIWQGHFGEALVRTPNNWGKTGEAPTHPELLDFLAKRFIESGWSVKAMHRMIVLSSTYQMDSRAPKEVRDADPANRLYARFNRVRMNVEQIRDSFLAIGGNLDTTIGGSLLGGAPMQGKRQRLDPDELGRRTVYIPVRRGSIPTVLATFDYGDATTSGEGRPRTNVAPQALFVMNSQFVQRQAAGLAKRLLDDGGLSDAQRVEQAYFTVLTRGPDAQETDSALTYISDLEKRMSKPDAHQAAWQSFCHVLMSTNEFLYLN
jgi:uncharacterized protein DUF1553/uncharacterized protein DUF1549